MKKIISIRDYPKAEREFFEDKKGDIKYNENCLKCSQQCKQSFRATLVSCKKIDKVHSPQEYIKEILNQKKDVSSVGKEIGINSRTVKSMLYESQDMSFEVYDKLDRLLFPDSKRNKK